MKMDTLGIEARASRMLSGCDTITPCALESSRTYLNVEITNCMRMSLVVQLSVQHRCAKPINI